MPLRFIQKRPRQAETAGGVTEEGATPTTITGLHGTDITITGTGQGVYILSGGQIAAHLMLNKIANWTISNSRVTLYSLDDAPLELTFLTPTDASTGLAVIEAGLNALI